MVSHRTRWSRGDARAARDHIEVEVKAVEVLNDALFLGIDAVIQGIIFVVHEGVNTDVVTADIDSDSLHL